MSGNIKNLLPNSNAHTKQGYFDKYNPRKYFGERPIIFRSGWELRFMLKCELNPCVIKWSSEQIEIPYLMQEKINGKVIVTHHNYNTDFTVFLRNGKKYIIEVKPLSQSPQNIEQIQRSKIHYKNACKWKAALEFAKLNGYEFKVVNENHLKTRIFTD